jgi:hypothetical protein
VSFNIVNNIHAIMHPRAHTAAGARAAALSPQLLACPSARARTAHAAAPPLADMPRFALDSAAASPPALLAATGKAGASGGAVRRTTTPCHRTHTHAQRAPADARSPHARCPQDTKAVGTTAAAPESCNVEENCEYWGDVVAWGTTNLQPDAGACCAACAAHKAEPGGKACNTWVYCGAPGGCASSPHKSCWLKWQPKPSAPAVTRGKEVMWTSGAMFTKPLYNGEPGLHKKYHVIVTANAAKYVAWQVRVMYYWYKKRLSEQGPDGQMGGFTRVLHEGHADDLMSEIPTCVVDRLSEEYGFVVLSRPNALLQMLARCDIPEAYILMAEPDHIMLSAIPNLMVGEKPAAFPFFYIQPKDHKMLIRRYVEPLAGPLSDADIEAMDPIGNSPNFISKKDLAKLAPVWANFTVRMKLDPECDKAWGWVLEMYAYTAAARAVGISHDLHPRLAAQPPWDTELKDFLIIHYTYGNDYTLEGVFTPGKIGAWRFDKRSYMGQAPPRNLPLPPKGVPETVVRLIESINEASANIPNWG